MNEDRTAGTARNIAGKVQEDLGRATGDRKSEVEGMVNRAAGAAQDLYGQARDAAEEAVETARQHAADAEDYIRETIEKRPYTTAIVALCVGWLIGRMGRHE